MRRLRGCQRSGNPQPGAEENAVRCRHRRVAGGSATKRSPAGGIITPNQQENIFIFEKVKLFLLVGNAAVHMQ